MKNPENFSILIVDDDKFMVEILQDTLSQFGFELFTAYSLQEMWEVLEGTQIDLILLDILFPGETAFDHLPQLSKRFPDTGVVLISAKKEREDILRALRAGVLDFIPKPIDPGEVEFVIKKALERIKITKENKRLTNSLRERITLLRLLLDASNSINSSLEMEDIFKKVLSLVKNIFQCEGSSILIYNPKDDVLEFKTVVGGSEEVKSIRLRKDQGIAGWCFTHKRPVVVEDTYKDPRFTILPDSKTGFKTKNLVAVPISTADGTTVGVLELINLKDMEKFKREQYLDALLSLSNQIAGALERAQLMKEVIAMNDELDKMNAKLEDMVVERTRKLQQALEELKATQDKLIATEKIAVIGELAAGIAHELNNALGYVSSNFYTMQEYLQELGDIVREVKNCRNPQKDCEKVKEKLQDKDIEFILEDTPSLIQESNKGIDHVKKIIKGLKLLSRVDKGSLEMANLNDLIKDSLEFAHAKLKYVPTVDVQLSPLGKIYCYPHKLNQVFINILNNAADAVDQKTGEIKVKTWEDDEFQYVSIKDNGPGIPEENLNKIFNPFFTTKPPGKGTGLGLSISYGIIQDHYGEIEVNSEEGKGTEFIIKIPKNLKEIIENKEISAGEVT